MRFVFFTMRWDKNIAVEAEELFTDKQPVLFAFWHGRLLFASGIWKKFIKHTPLAILVSQHGDGDYATAFINHYGIQLLRGSTSRGAVAGAKAVLKGLKEQRSVALTIDGPRGPRMRMNSGIARLATKSNVPIITFCYSAKWAINVGSWDRMLIPLPFSKGTFSLSKPFHPERGLEEEANAEIEHFMIEQQDQCDAQMKRVKIYPADRT